MGNLFIGLKLVNSMKEGAASRALRPPPWRQPALATCALF